MTPARPNVVFFLPDQLRPDFLGCYGADCIATPHIDSIAARGIRYRGAVSSSPLCVPARTALLTGISALRNGVLDNHHPLRPDYADLGIRTWPQLLGEHGYHCAAIGKMHFHPWDSAHGFHERVSAEDKLHIDIEDDYHAFLAARGLRKPNPAEQPDYAEHLGAIESPLPYECSVDHFVGSAACRFIATYDKPQPFALMVGIPSPHTPYDPTPEFLEQVATERLPAAIPEVPGDAPLLRAKMVERMRTNNARLDYATFTAVQKRRIRAHYAALVRQVDEQVGRILSTLDARGLTDNTVLVLSSDHGDYLGDHNLIDKASFFESAIRVPLLLSVPGGPRGVVRDELVDVHDITATILQLAGCDLPDVMDARPLPGLVDGVGAGRDHVVGVLSIGWMAFDGRWKLHRYATGESLLFDLGTDPYEQHNRIADPLASADLLRLDGLLTRTVLAMVGQSYDDRLVGPNVPRDPDFIKRGWHRPYPRHLRAWPG